MAEKDKLTEDEKKRLYRALTRADKRSWRRVNGFYAEVMIEAVDRVLAKREVPWSG